MCVPTETPRYHGNMVFYSGPRRTYILHLCVFLKQTHTHTHKLLVQLAEECSTPPSVSGSTGAFLPVTAWGFRTDSVLRVCLQLARLTLGSRGSPGTHENKFFPGFGSALASDVCLRILERPGDYHRPCQRRRAEAAEKKGEGGRRGKRGQPRTLMCKKGEKKKK